MSEIVYVCCCCYSGDHTKVAFNFLRSIVNQTVMMSNTNNCFDAYNLHGILYCQLYTLRIALCMTIEVIVELFRFLKNNFLCNTNINFIHKCAYLQYITHNS